MPEQVTCLGQRHCQLFVSRVYTNLCKRIMNVADMMTNEGIASNKDECKLIGEAPNRVLQYNVVHAAVHNILGDFDNEALNDELTDAPLFHGQKLYSVSNFRGKYS